MYFKEKEKRRTSTEDADDSRKSARLGLAGGGEESLHLSGLPPIIPDKYGYKRKLLDEEELMARMQDINSVKGQRQKQADVEIALICLMKEYSFSLEVLKRCQVSPFLYYHTIMNKYSIAIYWLLFLELRLTANFSQITYDQIAEEAGLDASRLGQDIPTFRMHQARLPDCVFL